MSNRDHRDQTGTKPGPGPTRDHRDHRDPSLQEMVPVPGPGPRLGCAVHRDQAHEQLELIPRPSQTPLTDWLRSRHGRHE